MRKFLQFFTSRFFILALLLTSQIALIVAFSVLSILTDYGYYYYNGLTIMPESNTVFHLIHRAFYRHLHVIDFNSAFGDRHNAENRFSYF